MAIKIGLDAGHGLKTAGKQTPDGIKEWTLNDKVRDKVVSYLADYDCEIIHTDGNEGATDESLASRVKKYRTAGVSAFVSIHHNAYTSKWNNATGVEVYTDRNSTAKDKELANCIYTRLVKNTGLKGRGVKEYDFAVINQDTIPAVLVEGGFMDGTSDYKYITSDAGQTAYAKAVAEGLIDFLNLKKKTVTQKPTTTATKNESFLPARGYFKKGDKGEEIHKICVFFANGYYSYFGNTKETAKLKLLGKKGNGDYFGDNLYAWTKEFQRRTGLEADGYIGKLTLAKLKTFGFKE